MPDNQRYIWWDKASRPLGPLRVSGGSIALHEVNNKLNWQRYTKMKWTYFNWVMLEKMDSVSSQNWMEGVVDFQDSTGTTKDTVKWGCL